MSETAYSEVAFGEPATGGFAHEEHYDPEGMRMGMWLFLLTEFLVFGGMFIAYGMYLHWYRPEFLKGSEELSLPRGVANTVILLTSSLTVVLAITAMQAARKGRSIFFLACTILLAAAFIAIKYTEWSEKFHHGIYPGADEWLKMAAGSRMFFTLYFVMTGMHALHVVIGAVLLAVCAAFAGKGWIRRERHVMLENCGLFWHLVDMVWIFLFPLFYLVR